MPLRGAAHSPLAGDEAPFFRSLADLDEWASKPTAKLTGCLPFKPRPSVSDTANHRGKLLACHDYKGGYTEKPEARAYTFNFWSLCDTFIYFSHHRVTIPPSGWINAAHRQGVKMLGTLIFEHQESEAECLRLLVGRLPQSQSGPAHPNAMRSLPVSPHYARLLAELAQQRGFDGYLLNVEVPLRGSVEQTRALCMWIALLEHELKRVVGEHAQVMWYDSVILDGRLAWQDRLNAFNLPFFMPSNSFFTNYTWGPNYPSLMANYFLSLAQSGDEESVKKLRDIFVGIDVWGRGQHGGGGTSCYKAMTHIDPEFLGLSVALFGHAWTWESEQDKPGWNWDAWWKYERTLWVGPADAADTPDVEDPHPPGHSDSQCNHGPYKPISSFFLREPPPNPSVLPFFTSFSPGVGQGWYVNGQKVWEATTDGWTDVDKNSSTGDLLWPRPALAWHDFERLEPLPAALPSIDMHDAWLGGNSIRISLSVAGSDAEDAFFRCLWIPIQSLALSPGTQYIATLVYKDDFVSSGVEGDLGLFAKVTGDDPAGEITIAPLGAQCGDMDRGWKRLSVQLTLPAGVSEMTCALGMVLGFAAEDPTGPLKLVLTIGSLAVHPAPDPTMAAPSPRIIWADHRSSPPPDVPATAGRFSGELSWEVGEYLPPLTSLSLNGPEDPKPAWPTSSLPPALLYCNVYALPHTPGKPGVQPEDASFIGTTGFGGRANRFYVDPACLASLVDEAQVVRFYVQGVTERGVVLPWQDCVFVDVTG
ncbi:glycoside hydrolase family 85 protein [Phlebiopsis gigantea 11061_1 CR5-6]|uniref:Glycoside hydrolase family 85 protein n=1 Tax=Phlebiopsis gigantea (strain 11061_1 CR5-6) TaxID=745531 RepID=A0A0C3SB26_PHLG1|nr:glycoside hydrolase family 85 protein [Phlebiopsis gigantea 11061_1 CR5-6]